jgi:hypothetical protein
MLYTTNNWREIPPLRQIIFVFTNQLYKYLFKPNVYIYIVCIDNYKETSFVENLNLHITDWKTIKNQYFH